MFCSNLLARRPRAFYSKPISIWKVSSFHFVNGDHDGVLVDARGKPRAILAKT
jgi:hypothetical protein